MNGQNDNFESNSPEVEPPLDSTPSEPSASRIQSKSVVDRFQHFWTGKNKFERTYPKLPKDATPEQAAQYLVEKRSHFVPSRDIPSPSRLPGVTEIEDLAAVIGGAKPAALLFRDTSKEVSNALLQKAHAQGLEIKLQPQPINQVPVPEIIVGNKQVVEEIYNLMTDYLTKPVDEHYHRELGRLLGYPPEAIDDLIKKIHK